MRFSKEIFLVCVFFSSLLFSTPGFAYINYSLEEPLPGLAGNSVIEIIYDGNNIWIGTGNGLSYSPDSGGNWLSFDHTNGLNSDGVSAIGYKDSRLWVALSYNQLIDGVLIPYGAGFNMTTDQGANWNSFKPG
ncbi:MAG: hypothetical protein OEV55_05095, partial [candidate division Zixibacteria bacterium]|nr:hypothetical protein [candidate division Zixibacteria bacterium]